MHPFIGFIGGGNMAASLISGLLRQGIPGSALGVADPDAEKRTALANTCELFTTADNLRIAEKSDVIVLAVKPQILGEICRSLRDGLASREPLIISIAAGVDTQTLTRWLGGPLPLVRAMPNTPAMLGYGATGLFATPAVRALQRQLATRLFEGVGIVRWLDDEAELDLVTALSGSGPAYFFLFMQALADGAKALGMDPDLARELTLQTAMGAAQMAQHSGVELDELQRRVTSPGGTTEQGLKVLEREGLRRIVRETLAAAQAQAVILSKALGASM